MPRTVYDAGMDTMKRIGEQMSTGLLVPLAIGHEATLRAVIVDNSGVEHPIRGLSLTGEWDHRFSVDRAALMADDASLRDMSPAARIAHVSDDRFAQRLMEHSGARACYTFRPFIGYAVEIYDEARRLLYREDFETGCRYVIPEPPILRDLEAPDAGLT